MRRHTSTIPVPGDRADHLEQLSLGCSRLPVPSPGEADLSHHATRRVRQGNELPGRELVMGLLLGEQHDAVAREQHLASGDQRVAFDGRAEEGGRGAPKQAVEVPAKR